MLSVSDTGKGMSEEVQAHLFKPFFTTKDAGKGPGLGLSTVYGIIKQSGGHIDVHSTLGQGTIFRIYLPQILAPRPEVISAIPSANPTLGLATILVVEDESTVRKLVCAIVAKKEGYLVFEAEHGVAALELMERHSGRRIDLLVTDVVMPHMGGGDLVQHLAARSPETKVLYMSGYTDSPLLNRSVHAGECPFLQKPFQPDALVRKVREILEM